MSAGGLKEGEERRSILCTTPHFGLVIGRVQRRTERVMGNLDKTLRSGELSNPRNGPGESKVCQGARIEAYRCGISAILSMSQRQGCCDDAQPERGRGRENRGKPIRA